jgi:hypothetical protein
LDGETRTAWTVKQEPGFELFSLRFQMRIGFRSKYLKMQDKIWLPFLDTYRTMCRAPEPAFRQMLEDIRELQSAA